MSQKFEKGDFIQHTNIPLSGRIIKMLSRRGKGKTTYLIKLPMGGKWVMQERYMKLTDKYDNKLKKMLFGKKKKRKK